MPILPDKRLLRRCTPFVTEVYSANRNDGRPVLEILACKAGSPIVSGMHGHVKSATARLEFGCAAAVISLNKSPIVVSAGRENIYNLVQADDRS